MNPETNLALTDNVEPTSPKRNVRHQVGMDEATETCPQAIQNLCGQQPSVLGVFPPDDETAPDREREQSGHEEGFATNPAIRQAIADVRGDGHGDLGRHDGPGNEGDGRPFRCTVLVAHELPQDQQDIGIGKTKAASQKNPTDR